MQKKEIKKEKSKKWKRERKIEIDSPMREKQEKLFNHVRLVGKFAFFLAKLIFSHSYAN